MRYYEASSMIASSPEAVWAVLTDGTAWPSWDSGVDRVDGDPVPGGARPGLPRQGDGL
jgi:uncharacterized protein YndB with AHSA1/START domain